jgi:hypothetical protein
MLKYDEVPRGRHGLYRESGDEEDVKDVTEIVLVRAASVASHYFVVLMGFVIPTT